MALALMLVLQAAAAAQPAPAAPAAPAAIDFDLARLPRGGADPGFIDRSCQSTDPSNVVVCARRGGRGGAYPMAEMERLFAVGPLVAETGIGGGGATARAYVESVPMNRGEVSNRVMVGIKLPF